MNVARKLDTFRRNPLASLRSAQDRTRRNLIDRWGKLHLEAHGLLDLIHNYRDQRPAHASTPQYADLWYLYKTVRERRPLVVWEFGAGNSTLILSQAIYDNGSGHLYSMDSQAEWAQAAAKALPVHLKRSNTIIHSPVKEVTHDGCLAWQHSILPEVMPNMAYLDGPALTADREVAIDLLLIEDKLPDDFYLVIDDRQKNTKFLREHFRRNYVFKPRKLFVQQVFELKT